MLQIEAHRSACQRTQRAFDDVQTRLNTLQTELDTKSADCASLSSQLADTQSALDSADKGAQELMHARKALEAANQDKAQLAGKLQGAQQQGGDHATAAREAVNELQAVRGLLRVVRTQLEETGCGYVAAIPDTDTAWSQRGLEGNAQAVLIALPSHLQVLRFAWPRFIGFKLLIMICLHPCRSMRRLAPDRTGSAFKAHSCHIEPLC
jgi:ABC-type transporter Mla subunit MlaD